MGLVNSSGGVAVVVLVVLTLNVHPQARDLLCIVSVVIFVCVYLHSRHPSIVKAVMVLIVLCELQ